MMYIVTSGVGSIFIYLKRIGPRDRQLCFPQYLAKWGRELLLDMCEGIQNRATESEGE
jgi:hypothetical protein